MTYEAFYGSAYADLLQAQRTLETMAETMKNADRGGRDVQPVVYWCSRVKKPESMTAKLASRGLPVTTESALTGVFDAVGLRIVCSFASDVQSVVEALERTPSIEIVEKKDYLSRPKPNGYRSVHLCVRLREEAVLAEIQVRTIAMDFWATLEHQLKYKKHVENDRLIKSELKRCADEIASVDLSMQTIREIITEL